MKHQKIIALPISLAIALPISLAMIPLIGFPVILVFVYQLFDYSLAIVMAGVLAGVCVFVISRQFISPGFNPFYPPTLISICYIIGYLLPLPQIVTGNDIVLRIYGYTYLIDNLLIARALGIALVGYVFFMLGFIVPRRRLRKTTHDLGKFLSNKRIFEVIVAYSFIGAIIWIIFIYSVGIVTMVMGMSNRLVALSGRYYFTIGAFLFLLAMFIWLTQILEHRRKKQLIMFIPLFGLSIVMLIFNGGSRSPLMVGLLSFAIILHYTWRRFSIVSVVLLFSVFSILYVTYQTLLREYVVLGEILIDPYEIGSQSFFESFWSRLFTGSSIQLQVLMITCANVPGKLSYQYGRTLVALLSSPIPRIIFPTKPLSPAGQFSEVLFPTIFASGTSVPPSLIGEFYWNFGLAGVIGGMFLFGKFYRFMYYRFIIERRGTIDVIGYALAASTMYPWLRGETFGPTVSFLLFYIPFIFGVRLGKARSKIYVRSSKMKRHVGTDM